MRAHAARPAARRPAPDAERLTWLALREAVARWRGPERTAASPGATASSPASPPPGPLVVPAGGETRPRLHAASLRLDAAAWR